MARICKCRVKYGGDENIHIFLNSVQGISRIIRLAGLVPDDCRIVCSVSEDAARRNSEKLPPGFSIGSTTDPVKLFNFYTSTCFEGQDIYDENGRTFIVSEKFKDHTKMDIQTSLLQICGRIRDSKYRTEITQLYAFSKYKEVSREEFETEINREVAIAEQNAQAYDRLVGAERERLIKDFLPKSPYIGVDGNGKIVMDRNLANYEIVNYNIVNGIYRSQVNMVTALKGAGLNVITDKDVPDEELESLKSIERTPFKEIFEEYCSLKGGYDLSFRANRIELEKPLVVEAYMKLGPDRVREMKYHVSNIKRELVRLADETQDVKLFRLIDPQLEKGVPILKSEIKELLEKAHKTLCINYKAKATELGRWYNLRETTKRGKDGKPQACFVIVSPKIKVGR